MYAPVSKLHEYVENVIYTCRYVGLTCLWRLEYLRGESGKFAALPLDEGHVTRELVVPEPLHCVCQAVRERIDVHVVDLLDVAGEHDLRVVTDAGDDRLQLVH
jgi:hypothetical protein